MASIPVQEELLAVTRKSQEAMITAIKTWVETVRTATPRFMSAYAPLAHNLPRLPSVTVPFADKLPTPKDAVASAYDLAEELLANQRKFAEDLLKAMTPLIAERSQSTPQAPSAPEVPAAGGGPRAATSPARKRTPASPAAKRGPAKNTPAKSTPAKSTPTESTPESPAPEGTTAS